MESLSSSLNATRRLSASPPPPTPAKFEVTPENLLLADPPPCMVPTYKSLEPLSAN